MGILKRLRNNKRKKELGEGELLLLLTQGGVGEDQAITVMYGPLRGKILNWICKFGGTREQASDIFQTGMMVLIEYVRKGKFEKIQRPSAFVFTVCKRQWYLACRKGGKASLIPLSEEFPEADKHSDDNISRIFEDEANPEEIQRHFGRLKGRCKQHLQLYYYESWSNFDIAQEFNSTENSVKSSRSQCISKLRKLVKEQPQLIHLFEKFSSTPFQAFSTSPVQK